MLGIKTEANVTLASVLSVNLRSFASTTQLKLTACGIANEMRSKRPKILLKETKARFLCNRSVKYDGSNTGLNAVFNINGKIRNLSYHYQTENQKKLKLWGMTLSRKIKLANRNNKVGPHDE